MNKTHFENTTNIAMFVGGKLLQPGEGREFNADDLPSEHQVPAADAPVALTAEEIVTAALKKALAGNVASVAAHLIAFRREELLELLSLEQAGANRKGVISALDAEILLRASKAIDRGAAGESGEPSEPADEPADQAAGNAPPAAGADAAQA